jgi:hypothetical protein
LTVIVQTVCGAACAFAATEHPAHAANAAAMKLGNLGMSDASQSCRHGRQVNGASVRKSGRVVRQTKEVLPSADSETTVGKD